MLDVYVEVEWFAMHSWGCKVPVCYMKSKFDICRYLTLKFGIHYRTTPINDVHATYTQWGRTKLSQIITITVYGNQSGNERKKASKLEQNAFARF